MPMATVAAPVESARSLSATIAERAQEIEDERSLPEDLVEQVRDQGLFHLMAPRSVGGAEADPSTIVEVIEELSRADASAGWTVLVGQGAGYLAWLAPEVAADLVARHPRPVIVGSMAPGGQARPASAPDRPALRISGQWRYNSGCRLADLIFGAVSSSDPPAPPLRFALFSPAQVEIQDTWRVAGLRGTGSHDLAVREVDVPMELTFDPFGPARETGALYRLPYQTYLMTALAGFPLGVARRIMDEFFAIAAVKRTVEHSLLAETPLAQADLARCEVAVRSARAGVFDALGQVWAEAAHGVPSPRSRALFTGSVQHAMRTALEVADVALRACGASQLYQRSPLQRYYRDIQAATQHIAFGLSAQRRVGAALLGHDVPVPFI